MTTDFEKLGLFYLGRELDPDTKARRDAPLLYDSSDLVTHARDRRHDRQRQDRPRHRPDRRSGDRRRARDRDRSERRSRQPAAHLPATCAGGLRAVGRCGRSAPRRPDAGGVRRRRSGEVVEGPGRVGPGRRAHRAAARRRRVRALHARQLGRPAAVDRQVVRGARSGNRQRRGSAAGSRRDGGHERADARRRRRRADAQPRAHAAVDALHRELARRPRSRSRRR